MWVPHRPVCYILPPSPFIKLILKSKQRQKYSWTESSRVVSLILSTHIVFRTLSTQLPSYSFNRTRQKERFNVQASSSVNTSSFTPPPCTSPQMHIYKARSVDNSHLSFRADYESGTVLRKCFTYVNSLIFTAALRGKCCYPSCPDEETLTSRS